MKKFYDIFAFGILLLLTLSCQKELADIDVQDLSKHELVFSCQDLMTKANEGNPVDNEALLNTIDVYFYRFGQTDQNAVFHSRISPGATGIHNERFSFTSAEISTLFLSDTRCIVYAVANVESSLVPQGKTPANSSIAEIKSIVLPTNTFGSTAGASHKPTSFVMDGQNTVTLTHSNKTTVATGTIPMYRIAAKLELLVNVKDTIHLKTTYKDELNNVWPAYEIWEPITEKQGGTAQVEAYLEYAYSEAKIGVRSEPETYGVNSSTANADKFYSYTGNRMQYDKNTTKDVQEIKRWTYADYKSGSCQESQVGQPVLEDDNTVMVSTSYMYSDPAYTYPESWTQGHIKEPFYKLVLPWKKRNKMLVYKKDGEGHDIIQEVDTRTAQQQYYYKVIFPVTSLESNCFYRFKLMVGILGSETDDAVVSITPTYAVAGWQNKSEVLEEAEVGNARFLSVPQSAYTLYNIVDLSIPFVSSDDCMIADGTVDLDGDGNLDGATWKQPYYGTNTAGKTKINGVWYSTGDASSWLSIEGKNIKLNHTLINTPGNNMDATPYTIEFYIRHTGEEGESFFKKVSIIQYPGIYMEPVTGGNVFVDGYFAHVYQAKMTGAQKITAYTYNNIRYDNYYTSLSYNSNTWNTNSGGNVATPYLDLYRQTVPQNFSLLDITKLTVGAFTSSSNRFTDHTNNNVEYIIGDPRQSSGWNASNLVNYLSSITGSGNRPTTKNTTQWSNAGDIMIGTTQTNIIAPSLLFSSAWSAKSGDVSFEQATKRCATYQEAGYPAGRWRLPTEAEVNFVKALQTYSKIPVLFADGAYYWTSSGYTYNGTNYNHQTNAVDSGVRCVYDNWYWGDTPESADTYHPSPTR